MISLALLSITGNRNVDMIIFALAFFLLLQGCTWVYKKFFRKDSSVIVGGSYEGFKDKSNK